VKSRPARPSLSDFVRTHPKASVEEVIRFGKRAGLAISRTLVTTVRAKDARLGPPPRTNRGAAAAFVRQHAELSADEVLALAKRKRVKVTREHIHVIRSRDRLRSKTAKQSGRSTRRRR
jgi:hypothetical protein